MSNRNGGSNQSYVNSHSFYGCENRDYYQFLVFSDSSEPIGFLSFSKISSTCLGFNALINDFAFFNSYRLCMWEACKIAHQIGFNYLNIQGSEDIAQFESKKRFKGQIQQQKIHMIMD